MHQDPDSAATADSFEIDDRSRMSFLEHLDELRRRIIYSLYALIAACVLSFVFVTQMFTYLKAYLVGHMRSVPGAESATLIYTQAADGFLLQMKVGILAGLLLASPFLFTQLWLFIAPGLYAREKRVVIPFVLCSTMLFALGVWFAHFTAFPMMWRFFAGFQDELMAFLPTIRDAFGLYVKVLIGLGLVFQMPILVFFLARFGVVTAGFLIKKFKYAVLIMFVVAAIITPTPDVLTQVVFVAPMLVLYVVSIGVAWVFGKKRRTPEA